MTDRRHTTTTQAGTNLTDNLQEAPQGNLPVAAPGTGMIQVGKVPGGGAIRDIAVQGPMTVRALFQRAEVGDVTHCTIDINGREATLDDMVQPGETVLAVNQVKGNV